jgi:hypothetical protein
MGMKEVPIKKGIKKASKITYLAFKFICKEGAKYLWNNHRVFLAVSLFSLILIALGYGYAVPTIILYYGGLVFWKMVLSYYED